MCLIKMNEYFKINTKTTRTKSCKHMYIDVYGVNDFSKIRCRLFLHKYSRV